MDSTRGRGSRGFVAGGLWQALSGCRLPVVYGSLAAFSVAIIFVNAFPSIRIYPLISLLLSIPLVIMALCAIFTNIRASLAGIAAIAICVSIWTSNWPLRARFSFSRARLESLANDVENGKSVNVPLWAGTYRIRKIDIRKTGAICFWTDLSPSGYSGIVRCSENKMDFNIWSHIPIVDDWRFIAVD